MLSLWMLYGLIFRQVYYDTLFCCRESGQILLRLVAANVDKFFDPVVDIVPSEFPFGNPWNKSAKHTLLIASGIRDMLSCRYLALSNEMLYPSFLNRSSIYCQYSR